jgi:hypothetical protein
VVQFVHTVRFGQLTFFRRLDVNTFRNYVLLHARFEVFTEVTMKNTVFWEVALCRSCVN